MPCITFGITWGDENLLEVLQKDEQGNLQHPPRLYEVETATDMGIPFDHNWYQIPPEVRAQHIAARLARISITNKIQEEARHNAKSR